MAMRRLVAAVMAGVVGGGCGGALRLAPESGAQDVQQTGQGTYRLNLNANIVLTNVVVRDKKTGAVVKGLKASDFTIYEDKKPQKIISFDYQNVDEAAVLAEKSTAAGKASGCGFAGEEFCGESEGVEGPSADCDLFRFELDAG